MDPAMVQLFCVLAGGAVAVGGGFASTYLMGKISRAHEHRKLLRHKLEELCLDIGKDFVGLREQYGLMMALFLGTRSEVHPPEEDSFAKATLATNVYYPELLAALKQYTDRRNRYLDLRTEVYRAIGKARGRGQQPDPAIFDSYSRALDETEVSLAAIRATAYELLRSRLTC